MKITNTQPGPRGVNAVGGPVMIDAGQSLDDVKVYAREREGLEASGWFTIEGEYEPDPSTGATIASPPPGDGAADKARIAELEDQVKAKDAEITDLKKQLPETDIDKMTVAELRAHLAYRDIAFDSKKDKKDDLVTLAKAAQS